MSRDINVSLYKENNKWNYNFHETALENILYFFDNIEKDTFFDLIPKLIHGGYINSVVFTHNPEFRTVNIKINKEINIEILKYTNIEYIVVVRDTKTNNTFNISTSGSNFIARDGMSCHSTLIYSYNILYNMIVFTMNTLDNMRREDNKKKEQEVVKYLSDNFDIIKGLIDKR